MEPLLNNVLVGTVLLKAVVDTAAPRKVVGTVALLVSNVPVGTALRKAVVGTAALANNVPVGFKARGPEALAGSSVVVLPAEVVRRAEDVLQVLRESFWCLKRCLLKLNNAIKRCCRFPIRMFM